jgi:SAM-dependent methyltransferase
MRLEDFYDLSSNYYDADYAARNYDHDIPFYVGMARDSGGPVLEMGCGTGRVLLPIARAGVEIYGIDISQGMLDHLVATLRLERPAVQQCVTLQRGDIQDVSVNRQFPLVTAPFRIAQHLITREHQCHWLKNVARHLTPEGLLAFDVFQPDLRLLASSTERVELDRSDNLGRSLRRYARTTADFDTQTINITMRWVHRAGDVETEESAGSFQFHWYTRPELESLLADCGFELIHFYGSFTRTPFVPDISKDQIVIARLRS